jgi:hypothetical protein
MPVEYPLTDCNGLLVTRNRRQGDDRRKSLATPEDLQILFSQLPLVDPEKKH